MGKKVLLCDDEIHILRSAEIRIRQAGFDVRIARDGQAAWDAILLDPPDILITDVQMPGIDGFELMRRTRANPATRDLPILMLTAKGFELSLEEMAEKWGVAAVLAKPFSPRELVRRIDDILAATAGMPA
jgi:two-component system, OmpR family, alkaline phosphatase synthesis response regulator PhoP